ncbi:MAG: hypothetical protein CYPHOPRED_001717 [Cyphobasidiales sp. Tagirdzhanova-0007]|nr:MAG: hypothetical protein CYPHOPRED_001717 [Cyphobasidiales sp. Tagirdzhanova-0007]
MGDTLASELGMLATSTPRLITNFQPVAPGTNGGITPWGTFVSFLGGQIVSFTAILALVLESPQCRTALLDSVAGSKILVALFVLGGAAGLFGSALDSILGATLQETLYSDSRKTIIHRLPPKKDEEVLRRGRPILSNNGVNVAASWTTGLICGWIGWRVAA